MKNFVKILNIHDGQEKTHYNGNRLYIESKPRAEKVIAAFLNDGWQLAGSSLLYTPSIDEPGNFRFYLGGWEVIFTKVAEDDAIDNSDEIILNALQEWDEADFETDDLMEEYEEVEE